MRWYHEWNGGYLEIIFLLRPFLPEREGLWRGVHRIFARRGNILGVVLSVTWLCFPLSFSVFTFLLLHLSFLFLSIFSLIIQPGRLPCTGLKFIIDIFQYIFNQSQLSLLKHNKKKSHWKYFSVECLSQV